MTVVVVSPHLDDAVLSVAGTILRAGSSGERVVVLTVFDQGDDSYARRRREDRAAACTLLGCEPLHLGLQDAPYRRGLPRTFASLVMTPLGPADEDSARVRALLSAAVRELAARLVLLPLAVGDRIDHRIVDELHHGCTGPVAFYEDRPYALVRHAVLRRLLAIGAEGASLELAATPHAAEEFVASALEAPYIQAYLDEDERRACLRGLASELAREHPPPVLRLRVEEASFEPAAVLTINRAIACYESQLADLFGAAAVERATAPGRRTDVRLLRAASLEALARAQPKSEYRPATTVDRKARPPSTAA